MTLVGASHNRANREVAVMAHLNTSMPQLI